MSKYTKQSVIYSGPISDIYRGLDSNGNGVALKVVDLDFVRKPHNFRQEVALLKKLQHKGIAHYIDTYSMGDDQVLVMTYYAVDLVGVMAHFMKKRVKFNLSNPLANVTVAKNEIPLEALIPMVNTLVDALKYIHSQQIIHRDIKPANIMFKSLENLAEPVIGDFGISYDQAHPPLDEPLDNKITDISTGYYKAPELCFGVTDYGREVDLWSLGIVLSYLYSANGKPCNYVEPKPGEREIQPELNDFVLIQGIFEAFGTPTVTQPDSELYWAKLGDAKYHFVKFQYAEHARRTRAQLLPRCVDEGMFELFEKLTRYSGREL